MSVETGQMYILKYRTQGLIEQFDECESYSILLLPQSLDLHYCEFNTFGRFDSYIIVSNQTEKKKWGMFQLLSKHWHTIQKFRVVYHILGFKSLSDNAAQNFIILWGRTLQLWLPSGLHLFDALVQCSCIWIHTDTRSDFIEMIFFFMPLMSLRISFSVHPSRRVPEIWGIYDKEYCSTSTPHFVLVFLFSCHPTVYNPI